MVITRQHELGSGQGQEELLPTDLLELVKPSRDLGKLKTKKLSETTALRKLGFSTSTSKLQFKKPLV